MNKIVKIIITIAVFTLVVLYFIVACGNGSVSTETSCQKFNNLLMVRIEEYFNDELPQTNGDTTFASVSEIIDKGLISLEDLTSVGTSCSGNAYVTMADNKYYYYNDIVCGSCDTNNLYTAWSDWTEQLPNLIDGNSQVQANLFYNYGSGEAKFTDWSDWGSDIAKLNVNIPTGVEVVDTETEEKTQYSYRDGEFKWYKNTGGTSYYNNGSYYEKQPSSGYSKDTESKKTSRTSDIFASASALNSSLNGYDFDTVTVKQKRDKLYVYSYQVSVDNTSSCKEWYPKLQCYKETYGNSQTSSSYNTYNEASNACASIANATNCTVHTNTGTPTCTCPSGYTPSGSTCSKASGTVYNYSIVWTAKLYDRNIGGTQSSLTRCEIYSCTLSSNYGCKRDTSVKACITGSGSWDYCGGRDVSYDIGNLGDTRYLMAKSLIGAFTTCNITPSTSYVYANPTCTPSSSTYYFTYTPYTRTNYSSTSVGSCPSGFPEYDNLGNSTSCKEFNKKTETRYLKKNGGYSLTINDDNYLSASDYSALGNAASSYSKTSTFKTTDWVNGSCSNTTNCESRTTYKATIYSYKWYKTSSVTKTACGDGEYYKSSPASGCEADTSTAKWGNWTNYSDEKVTKSTSREVRTQVLKKIKKSYIDASSLMLEEWLPLKEFEEKIGKTKEELLKDKKYKVQVKTMYKYRLLK